MNPILLVRVTYLLATTTGGGHGGRWRGATSPNSAGRGNRKIRGASVAAGRGVGRNRYTRQGIKKRPSNASNGESKQEELHPLPPLTEPNGSRPSYFTCRHNYENTLIDEIQRYARISGGEVMASSPYPGLVRVEDDKDLLPTLYDPVYALQSMPHCAVVEAESIKGIAREVIAALLSDDGANIDEKSEAQSQRLRMAKRGSLIIHPLVPGMCKGQTSPFWLHRSEKIGEELSKMLKKSYPAARKAAPDSDGNGTQPNERWMLQMMLQSPSIAAASLVQCQHVGQGRDATWPNSLHPLGMARVDIEERMPSSAYRKLMEGLECMGVGPSREATVVDLGASPGGWTAAVRRCFGCRVIAVDRSEVDPALMRDGMVDFVQGDAFSFEPPRELRDDLWMISDVIAYPERATELLSRWCGEKWASNMIVTMKFQGDEPDLDELDRAASIVKECGYHCRVKHFFNNKNEVTFMVSEKNGERERNDLEKGAVGNPMFSAL
mmetsp:Transcript_5699/g.12521  ORF Transcript_5699/g.12521 Transcript_5699/m.12521 type:complete len:494 (+) Transcript_5699:71-1552(+)